MTNLRSLPLCAFAGVLFAVASASTAAIAQQPANQVRPEVRIVNPIDESQLVTLKGNVVPAAIAKNDRGPVSASLPMRDLVLVLSRSPEQQAAFDAYVQSEYDSSSPNFHQWLTADQIGQQFGPSETDIATITGWLASQGFAVSHTAKDRMTITFSGTAGQVESAFHTAIHNLSVNGKPHIANLTDPQIPAALAPVVLGVKGLHNFLPRPLHKVGSVVQFNQQARKWQRVTSATGASLADISHSTSAIGKPSLAAKLRPQFGIGIPADPSEGTLAYLEEDVTPYDFATIYNVLPLWNNSITGGGQTIAIAGTSDIDLSDVTTYRSAFDLPAGLTPEEVKGANGIDPGICTSTVNACGIGDLEENSLDVELSGAVATGAQIVLVTSGYNNQTTPTNDPIYESSQYVVDNHNNSSFPLVSSANILSVSYGQCELFNGTAGNVAYNNLWQSAAAEGISVFVATGDSGSPSCDQGGDSMYGNPYSALYGLSVSGLASTPYNTAVGGTDFSWCKPVYSSNGESINGCPDSTSSPGPYWNTTNASNGSSAIGYVPETPWNDTCTNPIWAAFLESLAPLTGYSTPAGGTTPAGAEAACNFVQNDWYDINEESEQDNYGQDVIAYFVDTVGGSGGGSSCVSNDSATNPNDPTCATGATSTGATTNPDTGTSQASLTLYNNGWPKPSWQTGVEGIPSDGVRDLPDVSFFSGDGSLDSATLICVSDVAPCTYSDDDDAFALEIGGTSVATPEMAGVMALINQHAGAAQGLANPGLYSIAQKQTYSSCSAEGPPSNNCYFHSIDEGTNAMPCDLGASIGGALYDGETGEWELSEPYAGIDSPNCAALNAGDTVGTLVSSGTTRAYNATAGYNLATGLGSLNVANVVDAWVSDAGTAAATVTATLSPTGSITASTALALAVTVTGSSGTPTGNVTVTGNGANSTQSLSSGSATVTIPAGTLAVGSDTLTITYSGNGTYASTSITEAVTVTGALATVTVTAPSSQNLVNPVTVSVGVSGPQGTATPTGTVTLTGGGYSSTAVMLSASGTASFTIPANSLTVGNDVLTATYAGNATYTSATGTATVVISGATAMTPTVKVTTTASSPFYASQALSVTATVTGSSTVPTGTVSLTATGSSAVIGTATLSGGIATISVPGNTLSAGTDTLTVDYSGDAIYAATPPATPGTTTVTVTASIFALTATTPTAVSPGSSTTSSITGTASTTDYTGTVTLNSCTQTSSSVTSPTSPPTCTVSGTITYASGTATGSGTATITTTSNSAMLDTKPGTRPGGKSWLGAGGGAVLAFLVFLGVPARRRSWRALLGMVVLLASLGSLAACGGGSISGGGGGNTATSAGTYTFTVTGQGNDPASTQGTGTFTVTVN